MLTPSFYSVGLHITRRLESGTVLHVFYTAGSQPENQDDIYPNSAWGKRFETVEIPIWADKAIDGAYEWREDHV